jgi:spermidine/putrescine transport system ATP-binding protein
MSQTVTRNKLATGLQANADIELRKVFKQFNGDMVVRGIDLTVGKGEFFSILGPSGCGKTTTLRIIAGFEAASRGDVLIRGRSMLHVPPYRRPVNTVFQSYALFSHLTVRENIAFGLRIQKASKAEVQQRVSEVLRLVKMTEFAGRYPAQLSGGQQQRVALARALVNRPAVLLLDEPLGALDLKLRKEMQVELANLHQQLGVTFVMVTHDQEEALSLSDRIAIMQGGEIAQIGTPSQIYDYPNSRFVAEFIGETNLLAGKVEGAHPSRLWIHTKTGLTLIARPNPNVPDVRDGRVVLSIRPEQLGLSQTPPEATEAHPIENCFDGRLENVMYLGTHRNCFVKLRSGDQIVVRQPHGTSLPEIGASVYVYWGEGDGMVLPDSAL